MAARMSERTLSFFCLKRCFSYFIIAQVQCHTSLVNFLDLDLRFRLRQGFKKKTGEGCFRSCGDFCMKPRNQSPRSCFLCSVNPPETLLRWQLTSFCIYYTVQCCFFEHHSWNHSVSHSGRCGSWTIGNICDPLRQRECLCLLTLGRHNNSCVF